MNDNDFQLKIIITLITLSFTGVCAIGGYLVKRLIDDISIKIDKLGNKHEVYEAAAVEVRVQQKEHQMDIIFLKDKIRNH